MNIPIKFCWNFGYERSFSMMSPKGGQKKKSTKSMAWNHNNFLIESLLNSRIPTAHLFCKCIILLQLLTHITKKKLLKLILFSQPKSFFVFVCQLKLTNGYNWIWWGRQASKANSIESVATSVWKIKVIRGGKWVATENKSDVGTAECYCYLLSSQPNKKGNWKIGIWYLIFS